MSHRSPNIHNPFFLLLHTRVVFCCVVRCNFHSSRQTGCVATRSLVSLVLFFFFSGGDVVRFPRLHQLLATLHRHPHHRHRKRSNPPPVPPLRSCRRPKRNKDSSQQPPPPVPSRPSIFFVYPQDLSPRYPQHSRPNTHVYQPCKISQPAQRSRMHSCRARVPRRLAYEP